MLLPPFGFPAIGPPFGMYPDAPAALMVTEGFRACSPGPEIELVGVLPLTVGDVFTAGTAGGIAILPFTGEVVSCLLCCEPPATAAGAAPLEVVKGADGFLCALA